MFAWLRRISTWLEDRKTVVLGTPPRSPLWPKVRGDWIKSHPTCAACGGSTNLQVHHKVPFHLDPTKELSPENFITLCEKPSFNCHLRIGHCLDWSAFNSHVVEDAAMSLDRIKNRKYSL